jgi:hypothetical protein
MTDEPEDNVTSGVTPREPAPNPPVKSGGCGGKVTFFLAFLALAASVGSTGWILLRVQPAVRTATSAASALDQQVKASAASYGKLSGEVAALRAELTAASLPARADGLDKRISQVEASLGALARVAAADMAGRSMAVAASGAVLAQNEVSRLVTLASSIPETASTAGELGAALSGGAISRQSLKADLSRIADRIEEASAPQPNSTARTVQTFINRTVNDVGETLGLPVNQQSPAAALRDAYRSVDPDLASAIRLTQSSDHRLHPMVADWLVRAKARLAFEQSMRRLTDALTVVRQADKT